MKRNIIHSAVILVSAVLLTGCAANASSEQQLPAVLFYTETVNPADENGESAVQITMLMQNGTVYSGSGGQTMDEIAAQYDAGTLAEHYTLQKCAVSPDTAAAQYRKLCKAAADAYPQIVYEPDCIPDVEAPWTYWYSYMVQEDGTKLHITMGKTFSGIEFYTDNETVNAVCQWYKDALKG